MEPLANDVSVDEMFELPLMRDGAAVTEVSSVRSERLLLLLLSCAHTVDL